MNKETIDAVAAVVAAGIAVAGLYTTQARAAQERNYLSGLCIHCGDPPLPGHLMCERHQAAHEHRLRRGIELAD